MEASLYRQIFVYKHPREEGREIIDLEQRFKIIIEFVCQKPQANDKTIFTTS